MHFDSAILLRSCPAAARFCGTGACLSLRACAPPCAQTLTDNGVPDETTVFEDHQIDPVDFYIPILHLHWNDDLTVA